MHSYINSCVGSAMPAACCNMTVMSFSVSNYLRDMSSLPTLSALYHYINGVLLKLLGRHRRKGMT